MALYMIGMAVYREEVFIYPGQIIDLLIFFFLLICLPWFTYSE